MNPNSVAILQNILTRRTTKVQKMNGKKIEEALILELLKLADAAPTHARTEPWRINVYSEIALKEFCINHGEMYWDNSDPEKRSEGTKNTLSNMYTTASHLMVIMMRRTPEAKIPLLEEYAATSAAVQNILLGANALGISAIWNTGGMALKQPMKDYLNLEPLDEVVGFIYLGYTDESQEVMPNRNIPLEQKVKIFK